MQISVQLMLFGIAVFWIGIIILLFGKKKEIALTAVFAMGRRIYDNLDEVFDKSNVLIFKFLAYTGMTLVCIGIVRIFYELGW